MPPNANSAGHTNALALVKRLQTMQFDWPSEPELHRMDAPTIEALLKMAQTNYSVEAEYHSSMLFLLFLLLSGCMALAFMLPVGWRCLSVIFLLGCIVYASGRESKRYSRRAFPDPKYVIYALTQTDDMRVLPILILATKQPWSWHPHIRGAILRLLEHVTEEHIGLLDNTAQKQLWQIAIQWQRESGCYEPKPAILTLRALASVGNQTILERIKRLSSHYSAVTNESIVIAEAQRLLPLMEARLQRLQVPATLLRAADAPAPTPDTLLRATLPAAPNAANQLLRAVPSETSESGMSGGAGV